MHVLRGQVLSWLIRTRIATLAVLEVAEARRASPFAVLQMLDALGLEIRFHKTPGFNKETLEPRRAKKNSRLVPT